MIHLKKSTLKITASLKAVIARFHHLPNNDRVLHIIRRVDNLAEIETDRLLENVMQEFGHRHKNFSDLLMDNYNLVKEIDERVSNYSHNKKLLLGAYLTKEYSIQSAALFNPSIVADPDQGALEAGTLRFIMSLRATGEGHISSIIFKTGSVDEDGVITLDETSGYFSVLKNSFGAGLEKLSVGNYNIASAPNISLTERVIFPYLNCERMGMEDLRLVKFIDQGRSVYYGTYTAYDGKSIRTMLLETEDFISFHIRTLTGNAINDKGMALFPEKINGQYVMCSRQGSEVLSMMFSDDLYHWDKYQLLMEPKYDWEFVQIGNCGSPIKTEKGWLLLTHGVGAMRKYVISAILLDLKDPSKIIGRLIKPMITASEEEREGYVPNVVYTCGYMLHGKWLIIPYAISDTSTVFASVEIDEILKEMK